MQMVSSKAEKPEYTVYFRYAAVFFLANVKPRHAFSMTAVVC